MYTYTKYIQNIYHKISALYASSSFSYRSREVAGRPPEPPMTATETVVSCPAAGIKGIDH